MLIQVPVIPGLRVPAGSPVWPANKIQPLFPNRPELDATEHWLLGGSSASLAGLKGVAGLTPAGAAPTYGSGYVDTAEGVLNGLKSSLLEDGNDATVCIVYSYTDGGGSSRVLFGTSTESSANGGIAAVQNSSNGVYVVERLAASLTIGTGGQLAPMNRWMFVAQVINKTAGTQGGYIPGRGLITGAAAEYAASSRQIGLGNCYWNAGSTNKGIRAAEFMVFRKALSANELAAVYARSKTRMAARGITLS